MSGAAAYAAKDGSEGPRFSYWGSRYLAAKYTVASGPILFRKFGDWANELNWLFFICFVQYRKITFWL